MSNTMADPLQKGQAFCQLLRESKYVLALLGAGLSASSGIPTFSGAGRTWRSIDAKALATREAFSKNPQLISEYYGEMQQTMAAAAPNAGHVALAELARAKPGFLAITQNIDDLSQRAGHPPAQLACLHGSLFARKCFSETCTFSEPWRSTVTSLPGLAPPGSQPTQNDHSTSRLAVCPACSSSYLRPGVVWYGELLPEGILDYVDDWIESAPGIDVMLVVGTMAELSRISEFIYMARDKGAVIAHFDIAINEDIREPGDWVFQGDAAVTLPAVIRESLATVTM